jgi:hypothetical protein
MRKLSQSGEPASEGAGDCMTRSQASQVTSAARGEEPRSALAYASTTVTSWLSSPKPFAEVGAHVVSCHVGVNSALQRLRQGDVSVSPAHEAVPRCRPNSSIASAVCNSSVAARVDRTATATSLPTHQSNLYQPSTHHHGLHHSAQTANTRMSTIHVNCRQQSTNVGSLFHYLVRHLHILPLASEGHPLHDLRS